MNEAERWAAVVARDATYDGKFVYCVKTTKIFCRPICKARLARRANVTFCDTPAEAEAAGFRACLRCQPLSASYNPEADKVKRVCDILHNLPDNARIPDLEHLASEVKLTKHHFHRLFKRETGLTPRQYALSVRKADTNTDSIGSAAMTPKTPLESAVLTPLMVDEGFFDSQHVDPSLLDLGKDMSIELESFTIYYSIVETTCGLLLVAFQNHDIRHVEFGIETQTLLDALERAFPSLFYILSPVDMADELTAPYFRQRITTIVESLEDGSSLLDAPSLDMFDVVS